MKNTIKTNYKNHYLKEISLSILTLLFGILPVLNPNSAKNGIFTGAKYCLEMLIPSLFPFMFLARFVVSSDMLCFLKKPLRKITKTLFYLPSSAVPVIILSLVGGYPVGASGVKSLIAKREINNEQLNRMMCFSVSAGPAFIINIVGNTLLKNRFLGIVMFAVQVSFSILCAVLYGIYARVKGEKFYEKKTSEEEKTKISQAIVTSASQTSKATIDMCALVLIFTVLISMIQSLNISKLAENLFLKFGLNDKNIKCMVISFFEVTSGCVYALKNRISLPIISILVSFGGICTHLQILSILDGEKFSLSRFYLFRILNSLFSMVTMSIFLKFFKRIIPVFLSSGGSFSPSISSTALGSTFLLILCLKFTLIKIKNPKN